MGPKGVIILNHYGKITRLFSQMWTNIFHYNHQTYFELSFDLWPRELTIRPLRLKLNLRIVCLTSARIS